MLIGDKPHISNIREFLKVVCTNPEAKMKERREREINREER
jgi:hypothetical protein